MQTNPIIIVFYLRSQEK